MNGKTLRYGRLRERQWTPTRAKAKDTRVGGWMDGWVDGWMDGWTDGRTDGRTDGWN